MILILNMRLSWSQRDISRPSPSHCFCIFHQQGATCPRKCSSRCLTGWCQTPRGLTWLCRVCVCHPSSQLFFLCVLCGVLLTNELRVFTTQGVQFKAALFWCLCLWAQMRAWVQDGLPSLWFSQTSYGFLSGAGNGGLWNTLCRVQFCGGPILNSCWSVYVSIDVCFSDLFSLISPYFSPSVCFLILRISYQVFSQLSHCFLSVSVVPYMSKITLMTDQPHQIYSTEYNLLLITWIYYQI